ENGPEYDIGRVLKEHAPIVAQRGEFAEWYYPLIFRAIFPSREQLDHYVQFRKVLDGHIRENASTDTEIVDLTSATRVPKHVTLEQKEEFTEQFGKLAAEGLTTFRSFLLAETALSRGNSLGKGAVKTYCGFNHTEEIEGFLRDPARRIAYASSLPPELKGIHAQVTDINGRIHKMFLAHRDKFAENQHAKLLGWLARKVNGHLIDRITGKGSPGMSINIAEFRRLIEKK
ncbi:MAG TPA: hypothetical protein VJI13_01630, partial [Candidatus Norongarragalinales archaeon]|nr:hypothetical protein [Candidatus Norongarragalinales archaeon]